MLADPAWEIDGAELVLCFAYRIEAGAAAAARAGRRGYPGLNFYRALVPEAFRCRFVDGVAVGDASRAAVTGSMSATAQSRFPTPLTVTPHERTNTACRRSYAPIAIHFDW
ncbi:MAG: hypothetical protein IPN17_26530 [Deltaproteobacteria bacterium]|nr:hypothetical protein [Deltaproteobacteria bacterium]